MSAIPQPPVASSLLTVDHNVCIATNPPQCTPNMRIFNGEFHNLDQRGTPEFTFCEEFGGVRSITIEHYDNEDDSPIGRMVIECGDGTKIKVIVR